MMKFPPLITEPASARTHAKPVFCAELTESTVEDDACTVLGESMAHIPLLLCGNHPVRCC